MRRLLASPFTHKFLGGFALGAALILGVQQGVTLDNAIPQASAETNAVN